MGKTKLCSSRSYSSGLFLIGVLFLFGNVMTHRAWGAVETQLSYGVYSTRSEGTQVGNTKSLMSDLLVKLGIAWSQFFVGLSYNRGQYDPDATSNRTGYGLTVGYRHSGWFLDLTYFPISQSQLSSTFELTDGNGFGVDVGHRTFIGGNFFAGVQISYRSFTFSKYKQSNLSFSGTNSINQEYFPAVVIGLRF